MPRARAKDPAQGYAGDFVTVAMKSVLKELAKRGIKVVANAGGVNPQACGAALRQLCADMGVDLKVAVVEGDDVMPLLPQLRAAGASEMFTGEPLPEKLISANAYLGALPVAAALGRGADIVVTGRCADSALALGVLMHEFGWQAQQWDHLAAGSLVGHILECGAQATGGMFTPWMKDLNLAEVGYPIAEITAAGDICITKPAGTGGLVDERKAGT